MPATRNNTLDIMRIVAFCGVVVLHTVAPNGPLSIGMNILARFGVPFFFVVAGFFSLHASRLQLRRRLTHVARITLAAVALYAVTAIVGLTPGFEACCGGAGYPMLGSVLINFILWNAYPPAYPLWFLFALFYVYLAWIACSGSGGGRRLFFLLAVGCTVARIALGEVGGVVPPLSDPMRSWLLTGVPCFALGLAMRRCHHALKSWSISCDIVLIMVGVLCSAAEAAVFGLQEMYLGTMLMVLGTFACALRFPLSSRGKRLFGVVRAGETTMIAYMVHYAVVMQLIRFGLPSEASRFVVACIVSLALGCLAAHIKDGITARRA